MSQQDSFYRVREKICDSFYLLCGVREYYLHDFQGTTREREKALAAALRMHFEGALKNVQLARVASGFEQAWQAAYAKRSAEEPPVP